MFLLCAVIMTLATIWAGAASSFYQLLVAVCFQGLAEGLSTSAVGDLSYLICDRNLLTRTVASNGYRPYIHLPAPSIHR